MLSESGQKIAHEQDNFNTEQLTLHSSNFQHHTLVFFDCSCSGMLGSSWKWLHRALFRGADTVRLDLGLPEVDLAFLGVFLASSSDEELRLESTGSVADLLLGPGAGSLNKFFFGMLTLKVEEV